MTNQINTFNFGSVTSSFNLQMYHVDEALPDSAGELHGDVGVVTVKNDQGHDIRISMDRAHDICTVADQTTCESKTISLLEYGPDYATSAGEDRVEFGNISVDSSRPSGKLLITKKDANVSKEERLSLDYVGGDEFRRGRTPTHSGDSPIATDKISATYSKGGVVTHDRFEAPELSLDSTSNDSNITESNFFEKSWNDFLSIF